MLLSRHFSYRAGTSGEVSYVDSDREKNSLSNEHCFSHQPSSTHGEIHPFFEKSQFSTKIYGFSKKFFRSKESAKKVAYDSAIKVSLEHVF